MRSLALSNTGVTHVSHLYKILFAKGCKSEHTRLTADAEEIILSSGNILSKLIRIIETMADRALA